MPSLKDLKIRIESVKSTRKITKAMQMVAAAKLRRAQEAAESARPYAERMETVLGNLAAGVGTGPSAPRLLAGTGKSDTHLLVIATAERGLCGGFNSSIVKQARAHLEKLLAEGKAVKIMTVGKKGREMLRRDFNHLIVEHVDLSEVKRIGYANAVDISHKVLHRFNEGEFDVCSVFFSRFENVITQIPTRRQLIPAEFEEAESSGGGAQYEYEPEEGAILADLLPRGIATQIFTALLENAASEQGARMSAMDNATRNAGDMIDRLTIQYNRSRQAAITTELIEIIAGAEAL
ncbi:F0F1 ATP synthase subunit gamma [Amaricoccus macauensis]|uniref:F0F1 ATP synthase subunit gamma n=1 Tax=Amaricoccus macauensis TaxID=57001 RepID=UPI003C7BF618